MERIILGMKNILVVTSNEEHLQAIMNAMPWGNSCSVTLIGVLQVAQDSLLRDKDRSSVALVICDATISDDVAEADGWVQSLLEEGTVALLLVTEALEQDSPLHYVCSSDPHFEQELRITVATILED
jgi:hypothetical protein